MRLGFWKTCRILGRTVRVPRTPDTPRQGAVLPVHRGRSLAPGGVLGRVCTDGLQRPGGRVAPSGTRAGSITSRFWQHPGNPSSEALFTHQHSMR